jgi:hypothetical protein
MNLQDKEYQMLGEFHERQMKTLEQGINDINNCVRRNRLYILFLYEDKTIYGGITFMDDNSITIKKKKYEIKKINNIYSYFTLQQLDLEILREWYDMPDEYEE